MRRKRKKKMVLQTTNTQNVGIFSKFHGKKIKNTKYINKLRENKTKNHTKKKIQLVNLFLMDDCRYYNKKRYPFFFSLSFYFFPSFLHVFCLLGDGEVFPLCNPFFIEHPGVIDNPAARRACCFQMCLRYSPSLSLLPFFYLDVTK